jgi:hypothetical protein
MQLISSSIMFNHRHSTKSVITNKLISHSNSSENRLMNKPNTVEQKQEQQQRHTQQQHMIGRCQTVIIKIQNIKKSHCYQLNC